MEKTLKLMFMGLFLAMNCTYVTPCYAETSSESFDECALPTTVEVNVISVGGRGVPDIQIILVTPDGVWLLGTTDQNGQSRVKFCWDHVSVQYMTVLDGANRPLSEITQGTDRIDYRYISMPQHVPEQRAVTE